MPMQPPIDFNSWFLPRGYHGKEPVSPDDFDGYEYYELSGKRPLRLILSKDYVGNRLYADYLRPNLGELERKICSMSEWDHVQSDEISEDEYYALCAEYLANYKKMAGIIATQLNEIGSRKNNEDAIYPAYGHPVYPEQRYFMVCDGVGGQEKGEVASDLLTKQFSHYIKLARKPFKLEDALRHAEAEMKATLESRPETKGMASTLTVICFDSQFRKANLGWVGDSRVYHIRDGEILYKTKDHSEVQSLVDMGEITEEEALTHPKRNVITRAVNGKTAARMDEEEITDISLGDYFLLCTDGLLETLHERDFPTIFKQKHGPAHIRKMLLNKAEGNTKDNFSMYLLQVNNQPQESEKSKLSQTLIKAQSKIGNYFHRVFGKKNN